ncbi:MAG: hypothetical protein J1E65_03830 [Lachnospiraceae bacterium]|nr:hypothetical protein [Lachnospiraceae bacterium]
MARYIEDAGINQPLDVVSMVMEDYIYHNHYTRTDWNGEPVYSCRDAFGKERYLVWSYASGILHLEAWLKDAFGKEANLSGIGSGKSGKEFQKSLEELLNKLRTHSGDTDNIGYIGEDPFMHHEEVQAQPISEQGWSNGIPGNPYGVPGAPGGIQGVPGGIPDTNASAALVLGIIGLLLGACSPIIGLILGIVGKNKCHMADTSVGTGKTANIICTVAIILSIVMLLVELFWGIGGMISMG